MKKKFLIFCGEQYYANGGANDLISIIETKEKAIKHAKSLMWKKFSTNYWKDDDGTYDIERTVEWVQVYDLELCEIIFKEGISYGGDEGGIVLV